MHLRLNTLMRRNLIIVLSVGLNVALAVVLVLHKRHDVAAPAQTESTPPPAATNRVKTQVVIRKQFFSWDELESPDYPVFITRLRDIGCPEQTIRDIIIADVNQLYAKRRLAEVVTPEQQWWRSVADTNITQAANAKIQSLDQERRALLTTLLGPGWDSAESMRLALALNGPVLGDLSPEVKQTLQDIAARSQQRTSAYLDAQEKAGKAPDPAELARIKQQTRNELAQALSPAQLEEFLLRYSQTAADLRNQLHGYELSPDEFRSLFRSRDSIEQQLQLLTGNDAGSIVQKQALEKQLGDAMKNAMGADRYQAYVLSQDPAYRDAQALVDEYGASPQALQSLYKLNQAVKQEQDRINNDPTLTPEQKAAQLKAVELQQETASDQLLGLAPPPPPPLPPMPTLPSTQTHAYAPGETIDQIAAQYGVTPGSILNANPNVDFNKLPRGAPLRIPQRQ
ncbi:MAG: Peptidoglycan-binding LysM [Pedosphaera sp.]|nr:Peptidoglycan-binding LysM [Pedosphaera sp.]